MFFRIVFLYFVKETEVEEEIFKIKRHFMGLRGMMPKERKSVLNHPVAVEINYFNDSLDSFLYLLCSLARPFIHSNNRKIRCWAISRMLLRLSGHSKDNTGRHTKGCDGKKRHRDRMVRNAPPPHSSRTFQCRHFPLLYLKLCLLVHF